MIITEVEKDWKGVERNSCITEMCNINSERPFSILVSLHKFYPLEVTNVINLARLP